MSSLKGKTAIIGINIPRKIIRLIFVWLFAVILIPSAVHAKEVLLMNDENIGSIYLLNAKGSVDKECLIDKIKLIISYIDTQQIVPYKVEIWKDNPIVKEILRQETVRIERKDASKDNILIPLKKKGETIILYQHVGEKESYGMFGIISKSQEVDFSECAKL